MRRVKILFILLFPASLMLLSCGSSTPASTQTSGLKFRAFLTNTVSAGSSFPGVYIINAATDQRPNVSPISSVGNTPRLMVVTPNRAQTVVFSGTGTLTSDNQLTFVNNASETATSHLTLPGGTESFVISPDSSAVYTAVPTGTVIGAPPGLVKAASLSSGAFTGEVDIPSVRYLSMDNSGNRILGFSDNSDAVAVITPSSIADGNAVTFLPGFDRPIAAFFSSDDSTAFVVNCGAECGGNTASVQQVDLTTGTLGPYVAACAPGTSQCGASVALVNGSTMYLAGTPYIAGVPSQSCTGQTTAATTCGLLTTVDLNSMTVTNSTVITDGYHNRIALGPNGQLFIGAHTCTEIIPPVPPPSGSEVRGCLSIYNTLGSAVGNVQPGGVLIPAVNGDVTSIQPISTRNVVYLIQGRSVQGGTLYIYDTSIDSLAFIKTNPNNPGQIFGLVGGFFDVKTIDF